MHIVHLTSVHKDNDIRIFHKECASLAEYGFKVTLIAANGQSRQEKGVEIINVKSDVSNRIDRIVKTVNLIYNKALELDADVYHIHDPELLRIALKLKKRRKKVIYDVHEDVPRQILTKFWINKYLRKIISAGFEKYENYVSAKLDYIITATPFIGQRFLKVNPNTVDINNFPLLSEIQEPVGWENKKNQVCYLGAIIKIRGISEIIGAMEFAPEISLNMAGKVNPESYLSELKAIKGWKSSNYYGLVDRKDVYKIMESSIAGIVTFWPSPNHVDAQPNKMFEYMSAAIPVIGSNFPLWKDIVEKNECGICVDPLNPKEIGQAIRLLHENRSLAQKMGENGRKAVFQKYNWDKEKDKLIEIYKFIR